jgi:beta-1,4-mannooligosaccharide/beta-1,4-mannosyl-N-acetylglucosamine phosphorylase
MTERGGIMRRAPGNPILTRECVPDMPPRLVDATSVFNPGAVRAGGIVTLLLRVQARSRETFTVVAESADGFRFVVRPEIVDFKGIERLRERIYHLYDCRITALDGTHYVMFALDMDGGCRLGLARTDDFRDFRFLGLTSTDDVRNGVLFPEKIGGLYVRLERPNTARPEGGPTTGSEIWLAGSDDLLRWRRLGPVMAGRFHYWDEYIGSGPPPVKTRRGWLHIYHGVATHFGSANIYQAGVVLLDLEDPAKVLGRSRGNILEPRAAYELCGQVPNVVFPSGIVVDDLDAEGYATPASPVKVYYGAADTAVGLAETTIGELLAACDDPRWGQA